MKLIALDSSGLVASVALWENDSLIAEYTVNYKKTHSQTLLPMLDELKKMTELDLNSLDGIAVAAGPGSFTGLRIGSATAKGLGLALNVPIISVPTVDALAYQFYGAAPGDYICPIMDARREQVYTGIYSFEPVIGENNDTWSWDDAAGVRSDGAGVRPETAEHREPLRYCMVTHLPSSAMQLSELLEKLDKLPQLRRVIFLGDAVPVYQGKIAETISVPYFFAPPGCDRQRAAAVAHLAALYFAEGKTETAEEHAPVYLRMSQAERERLEAEEKTKKIL